MFWGTSTTDVVLLGVLYGITTAASFAHFTNIKNLNVPGWSGLYVLLVALVVIPVMELSVATYTATKSTVAVPSIFTYPATLLCCGTKRRVECFVTTLALWVNLVALQLVLLQANLIMFALSAAPFAVITNVMLVALALTCLANIFSLLFTMSAHLRTPADQRVHSSSMVLRAVVVLPLLSLPCTLVSIRWKENNLLNLDYHSTPLQFYLVWSSSRGSFLLG